MPRVATIPVSFLMLFCLLGCTDQSDTFNPSRFDTFGRKKSDNPVVDLMKVSTFAFGGVGYSGQISRGEMLFMEVWNRENRSELFRNIYKDGNNQAKAYALVGLYYCEKPEFDRIAKQVESEKAKEVECMGGCIVYRSDLKEIIKSMKSGKGEFLTYVPIALPKK